MRSNRTKQSKILCIIGSCFLLIMATFHGSGISYINSIVIESNSPEFIKEIFPVLFILPTIQLIGLATFGFVASQNIDQSNKILIPLSVFVFIDASLAFYLGATIPGVVLIIPSVLYSVIIYWNYSFNHELQFNED